MTINEVQEPSITHQGAHHYAVVSAHNTSEGRIVYQRCACGLWRIQRHDRVGGTVLEATVDHRVPTVAVPPRLGGPVYASI
jgi:hypothetical protein